ncbi:DUF4179 domain-containing protein [Desulfuribacillus alkaliarsenatis]|uniref:DUF4179 domain-containing protein n=1 Tax=Desulfuribacillus alkaliarsenatis TaxID=766136 RepID=A0A1E5G0J5_9FIRM|nr:DUF4179 domain-containing protein [Desulfuribacillus alkaliarsenatis]OEF95978.1 hypothetical protein BHF68_09505 [Desulfuribacillus alkaliarsenatis]
MRNIRKIVVIICILAITITGCGRMPDPPTATEVTDLIDYIGFEDLLATDSGLNKGMEMTPLLNKSVTNNGIEFTVHQVIADAIRTIIIYSYEFQENSYDSNRGADNNNHYMKPGDVRINELTSHPMSHGRYSEQEERYSSITIFNRALDRDIKKITIEAENLGGLEGEWSIEAPVYFMEDIEGRDIVTYEMLRVEEIGIGFTVVELTLGSTATYLNWVFREILIYEDDLDFTMVRSSLYENEQFFPLLTSPLLGFRSYPEFIMKNQVVYIEDESGNILRPDRSSGSSEAMFPPIKEDEEVKIIAKHPLLQSKEPVLFQIEMGASGWQTASYEKAGTTVTLDEVAIGDKTSIKLRYQYGMLGEMREAYILDNQGNRYELERMELWMPAYDELELTIEEYNMMAQYSEGYDVEEYRNRYIETMRSFIDNYKEYEKYQILYFPALPEDTVSFVLQFDEVMFVPDVTWEVKVEN